MTLRSESRRRNLLVSHVAARSYIVDRRTEADALTLLRGADDGVFIASSLSRVLEIEKWLTSPRTRRRLDLGGSGKAAAWSLASPGRSCGEGSPATPSGGVAETVRDLLFHLQEVHALSNRLFSQVKADPGKRRALVAFCNEQNALAAFATRAARATGIQLPAATELAALSLWVGVETTAPTVEEMDRRVDKFRKIKKALPRLEAFLDALT